MHGHQLRQLAEKEHVDEWTDIIGRRALRRAQAAAAEGLIEEVRVEREGAYPERQVWGITDAGPDRARQAALRRADARSSSRADPVRPRRQPARPRRSSTSCPTLLAEPARPAPRDARRRTRRSTDSHLASTSPRSSCTVMTHKADRLRAEIAWHEKLLARLPELLAEERTERTAP